ncbi:MAG: hypothetical protein AAFQ53_00120 [Bacteroidota bacterium]
MGSLQTACGLLCQYVDDRDELIRLAHWRIEIRACAENRGRAVGGDRRPWLGVEKSVEAAPFLSKLSVKVPSRERSARSERRVAEERETFRDDGVKAQGGEDGYLGVGPEGRLSPYRYPDESALCSPSGGDPGELAAAAPTDGEA